MKTHFNSLAVFKLLSIAAVSSFTLAGCMSTTSLGYGAERKQLFVTTQNYSLKKAKKSTDEVTTARERAYYMTDEARAVEIVNRLSPYADLYLKDGRKVEWDVFVYHDKKSNAGALADGTLAITYSMMKNPAMKNDDGLAYLIAHEMAHVIRQHHRERDTWNFMVRPALLATAVATSGVTAVAAAIAHDGQFFSKALEKEADLLGLEIIAKAGFDPVIAKNIFVEFEPTFKEERPFVSRLPSFMITHPSIKSRTRYSEKYLKKVLPIYEEAKTKPPLMATDPIVPSPSKRHEVIVMKNDIPKPE